MNLRDKNVFLLFRAQFLTQSLAVQPGSLSKLDKSVSRRILKFLHERIEKLDDPRTIGGKLQGALSEFWKYRVGDYRLICSLGHDR